jgi:hypothetical protein
VAVADRTPIAREIWSGGCCGQADLAEVAGLVRAFSELAPLRQRRSAHDPGRVLVDLAVMLVDGGDAISDLAVLRDGPKLFGSVASTAIAWRVLDGVEPPGRRCVAAGLCCRAGPVVERPTTVCRDM